MLKVQIRSRPTKKRNATQLVPAVCQPKKLEFRQHVLKYGEPVFPWDNSRNIYIVGENEFQVKVKSFCLLSLYNLGKIRYSLNNVNNYMLTIDHFLSF